MTLPAVATARVSPATRLRVLVVEDHELLAQILVHALRGAGHVADLVVAGGSSSILAMVEDFAPDIVLLDVDLGPAVATSGVDLIEPISAFGAAVIMVTGSTDRLTHAASVEHGARGTISKDASFDVLLEAIRRVAAGDLLTAEAERQDLLGLLRTARTAARTRLRPFERLTERERQVLAALMDGRSAADIASASFVSLATVRSQIHSVLVKLGVGSQLAAVAMARREGWIEL